MSPRLKTILTALRGRYGRDRAISASQLTTLTGIPERSIRSELETAYHDGTLESHEIPAVALAGIGFFLAEHPDDFQESYDTVFRVRKACDRKLKAIKRLARATLGVHLLPTDKL